MLLPEQDLTFGHQSLYYEAHRRRPARVFRSGPARRIVKNIALCDASQISFPFRVALGSGPSAEPGRGSLCPDSNQIKTFGTLLTADDPAYTSSADLNAASLALSFTGLRYSRIP